MKLIGVPGRHDLRSGETDKQQDTTLASFIDTITDSNIKTCIEDKLHDLVSKNETIHVCIYTSLLSLSLNKLCTLTWPEADKGMFNMFSQTEPHTSGAPCKGVRCPPIFSLYNLINVGWL